MVESISIPGESIENGYENLATAKVIMPTIRRMVFKDFILLIFEEYKFKATKF